MEPTELTLGDYLQILDRRKWSILIPALGIIAIAAITAVVLPSIYKSSSTILIEEQEIPADFVMATVTSYAEQRLQAINQRIMSSTRLMEIVNNYGLYRDLREKKTTDEIVSKMREDVKLEPMSFDVMDRRTGRERTATIAFTLSYEAKESPQRVQQVASQLASLFLKENLEVRERQTQETSQFLEDEAKRVKADLDAIETEIALFKGKHINELPEMLPMNLQTLNRMENDVDRLNEQLRTLKEREGYLETQLSITEPEFEKKWNVIIPEDEKRLEMLEVQLISLLTRCTEEHPDVIKTRAEISELKAKLDIPEEEDADAKDRLPENPAYITLASQLAGVRSDMDSIAGQMRSLGVKIEEYHRRIEAAPKYEEEYNSLQIERNNLQRKYDDLLGKASEADVAYGLEREQKGERFTLIDPARLPEKPYKPNRLAILLIGIVLGTGAGVGFAALREFTDNSVRSTEQLARTTSLPVLSAIPEIVTPEDARRNRRMRNLKIAGVVVAAIAAVLIFHFFVMDLYIFQAKLMRRLGI
jgi:succinoglycan biosynthesis transport protein ExoP